MGRGVVVLLLFLLSGATQVYSLELPNTSLSLGSVKDMKAITDGFLFSMGHRQGICISVCEVSSKIKLTRASSKARKVQEFGTPASTEVEKESGTTKKTCFTLGWVMCLSLLIGGRREGESSFEKDSL